MSRFHVFAALLMMTVSVGGCSSDPQELGSSSTGAGSGSTGTSMEMVDQLPCEVFEFFDSRCGSCHGETPDFGALRSLQTHEDLTRSGDGHDTMAEASLARMELPQDDEDRMPEAPRMPASSSERDLVQQFIDDGLPMRPEGETCN